MNLPKLKRIEPANIVLENVPPKKKILLLSDDMRMASGIATVSRELVFGTVDKYDWVQLGAALQHPDNGKTFDISSEVRKTTGVSHANVKIYANNGYGNQNQIRTLLMTEKPDVIMHFTDPRYWDWLYQMEHEIRQRIPLVYLNIWDDLPDPMYNRQAYASCDLLMAISKQTYGINRRVLDRFDPNGRTKVRYVPHGINPKLFYPITPESEHYNAMLEFKESNFTQKGIEFVVLWNNRNIMRKHPGDMVLAFKHFCDQLPPEEAKKCALLMHTQPIDPNGTDLTAVVKELCPYTVIYSKDHLSTEMMNVLYNIADVTVNNSSAEGFGLATAESIMAGTPTIVNVTGGLQDQCGFYRADIEHERVARWISPDEYVELGSLHNNKQWEQSDYLEHGSWTIPVWPSVRQLVGSIPTPYIFDDVVSFTDIGDAILKMWMCPKEDRRAMAMEGREYFLRDDVGMGAERMCKLFADSIDECIETFEPRTRFEMFKA